MTGGINRAIFPVIFLFLISILPLSQADSSDENGDNILTFSANSEIKSVYLENEVIEIEMALSNFGDNEIFSNDPSCDYYFEAYNEVDEQVYSTKSQCRGQSQSTFLEAMSTNLLQEKTWNFTDQNGSFIESGTYEFRLYHSTLPLANSFEIYFQHISNLEEGLEYQLSNFDNTILVSLSNPTKNEINPQSDYCTIILSINNISTTHRLCNENSKVIYPNQNLEIGYILLDYSMLSYGENVVGISDTGMTLSKNLTFDYLKITNDIDYEDIGIDLEIVSEKMFTIDRIPYLELTPYIYNNLDENLLITANNTCLLHNKIYNIRGDIIQDSYSDLCQPSDMNIIINSNEILSLPPISMQLVDQNNCYIDSGNYIISSQIMGTNLQHITNYYFNNIYLNQNCDYDNIDTITSVEKNGNNIDYSIALLLPSSPAVIFNPCIVSIELVDTTTNQPLKNQSFCDFNSGDFFIKTLDNDRIQFDGEFQLDSLSIDETTYTIIFQVNLEGFENIQIDLKSTKETVEKIPSSTLFDLQGEWELVVVDNTECWTLISDDSVHVVDIDSYQGAWMPKKNWQGDYSVATIDSSLNNCDILSIPIVELVAIHNEFDSNEQQAIVVNEEVDEELFITPVRVTVALTTTSLLAGLIILVSQTETLRIPVTSAGLWLFALVGKTHETSDGRFQRGRLIGYLTANPGCHFRALMAALKMSNGQITHHLRLLENQELIWRLNDGRFVRYYPLNNSLYPGMDPNELPIPQLSPDPNSLQGKILTILDDEHQLGEFPTQSELSKKLEKSQQLISHHLRTLQKYGLVEKRKMGIKNRYKLTKEAIFLLETDIDYLKFKD